MQIPNKNECIRIKSIKHDGNLHRLWQENLVLSSRASEVVVANERTIVKESTGKVWQTEELAIAYFYKDYYFNVITLFKEDGVHFYCNFSSPFTYAEGTLTYVDYDIDIIVNPAGEVKVLDEDEYKTNKRLLTYPESIDLAIKQHKQTLLKWIHLEKGPFSKENYEKYYSQIQVYKRQQELN